MYCNIIVTRPFNHFFTYDVGSAKVKNGQIVLVPFGKSTEVGMVFETNVSKPNYQIKKVLKIFDSLCFDKVTIKFIQWINDYTLAPIGSVLKLFLINDKIVQFKVSTETNLNIDSQNVVLNVEQEKAKKNIFKYLKISSKPIVLEGVTGSGKTEVYFDLIEYILHQTKQVLIMVPEISLTPQLEKRFLNRFGIEIDVWPCDLDERDSGLR